MNQPLDSQWGKVPEVTLWLWIVKVAAINAWRDWRRCGHQVDVMRDWISQRAAPLPTLNGCELAREL
jgi:hypothetical protein